MSEPVQSLRANCGWCGKPLDVDDITSFRHVGQCEQADQNYHLRSDNIVYTIELVQG